MPPLPNKNVIQLFEGTGERVVFCIPGSNFSVRFMECWSQLLSDCQQRNLSVLMSTGTGASALIARATCLCVYPNGLAKEIGEKPFNGVDYDVIMWIDSDQIFNSCDFFTLLESPHRVTCGSYVGIMGGLVASRELLPEHLPLNSTTLTHRERAAHLHSPEGPYMSLEFAGMGWFMMRQGILEALRAPWFFPNPEIPYLGHNCLAGEDVILCHLIRHFLKIPIMLDTRVHVGHEKLQVLR